MTFSFKPAKRENVGLLIGLVGPTGSGKTYTAMELASGIAGDRPFAVIDTEARRALHYADRFKFDHGELAAPFRPDAYTDAIKTADEAGYPAIVVDSASHSHAGEGGLLDWHEEELQRMAKDDWAKRERVKMAAWIKPKMSHKRMVQRLLQVRAHLILCFRAEEKIKMAKVKGKTEIVNAGWQPICEKNLPYEMTCSLLFSDERPGFPIPIKLQEQHRELFPPDRAITRRSGEHIRDWAAGGVAATIADVLDEINGANDTASLQEIGAGLAGRAMSPDDTTAARHAYRARLEALRELAKPEGGGDGV